MKMWKADAPANIAIVKYMGKTDHDANMALNSSISMTLWDFTSEVEISQHEGEDCWEPLPYTDLPKSAGERFLQFLKKQKEVAGVKENFKVRSGNSFPNDCGLASSASSFAALTSAMYLAFSELKGTDFPEPGELAMISRQGSGSSCRSFFSPWCKWQGDQVTEVKSKLPELRDFVLLFHDGPKAVSSSEAHKRVQTSPLINGRAERANERTEAAEKAIGKGDFETVADIAWADLWEMHSMFHTSNPPFTYFEADTMAALKFVENEWQRNGKKIIATIDAGPNVHLLVDEKDADALREQLQENRFKFLESSQ